MLLAGSGHAEESEVFFEANSDDEDALFEDARETPTPSDPPSRLDGRAGVSGQGFGSVVRTAPGSPMDTSGKSFHADSEQAPGKSGVNSSIIFGGSHPRDYISQQRNVSSTGQASPSGLGSVDAARGQGLAEAMAGVALSSEATSEGDIQGGADRKAAIAALAKGYPLHRAVFNGQIATALELLQTMKAEERLEQDPQGNTVLHIAVLRRRPSMVLALLDAGIPIIAQNARRWTALEEAISLRDKELVKLLHSRESADLKAEMKSKKGALVDSLRNMPDYSFQLKWELGSPVLGMLLRKYAPHDTYQVWKLGAKLRVDGSLMGLDDKRTRLLPQWKHGHFSLLFDGASNPATVLLCDHSKKSYLDLSKEKKRHKPTLDEEAALIVSEGAGKTKMRASEFRFKVAKTWLGGDSTERIEGWKTRIYEAAGKMVAVTTTKAPFKIPAGASFEDYLALEQAEDEVTEVPVDPYSMDGSPGKAPKESGEATENGTASAKKPPKAARRLTGKCWMAENFPMSLNQLLPILAIIGNANKHIARVGKFLQKYGDMSLFPVKLQVPLIYTVYALISFRQFKLLAEDDNEAAKSEDFYELPSDYRMKTFEDIAAKRSKRSASWDVSDRAVDEGEASDAQILSYMGL